MDTSDPLVLDFGGDMYVPVGKMGCFPLSLPTVHGEPLLLVGRLGEGLTSVVYRGRMAGKTVAVKRANEGDTKTTQLADDFRGEGALLTRIHEAAKGTDMEGIVSKGIPRYLGTIDGDEWSFVLTPVGTPVFSEAKTIARQPMPAKAIVDLVALLRFLHTTVGVCHLDLSVTNLIFADQRDDEDEPLRNDDVPITVIDWGFARPVGAKWDSGAISYLPKALLDQDEASPVHDLVILVRSWFLASHPALDDSRKRREEREAFWAPILESNAEWANGWRHAQDLALALNYDELGPLLQSLVAN